MFTRLISFKPTVSKPRTVHSALLIGLILSIAGCASVTGSTEQTVSVQAFDKTEQLQGAICEVENDKGKWFVNTPGTVQIDRSNEDLMIICRKDGHDTGLANVVSNAGASVAGNVGLAILVPIVGIVGALIDHNSGASYRYPTSIQVYMGQTVTVEDKPPGSETAAPSAVSAQVPQTTAPKEERFTITVDGVTPENPR
jgi:hypothetical protein